MLYSTLQQYVGRTHDKTIGYDEYQKDPSKYYGKILEDVIKQQEHRDKRVKTSKNWEKVFNSRHFTAKDQNEETHELTTLSPKEVAKNKEIQNILFKSSVKHFCSGNAAFHDVDLKYKEFAVKNMHKDELAKLDEKDKEKFIKDSVSKLEERDVINFLKANEYSKVKPNGIELLNQIINAKNDKERNEIFSNFLSDKMDELQNSDLTYKNDKDFAENYERLNSLTLFFTPDNSVFNSLKEAGIAVDQKVIDRYNALKPHFHDLNNHMQVKAKMMMDESYTIFTKDTIKNASAMFYEENLPRIDEDWAMGGPSLGFQLDMLDPKKSAFGAFKEKYKFNEKTKFLGPKGYVDFKEANKLYQEGKRVAFLDEKNNPIFMEMDKNGIEKTQENITPGFSFDSESNEMDPNLKESLTNCLNILNKGTSIFNKSSKEYKDMRGILTDLTSKNHSKDYLQKSLDDFNSIANVYLKNHDKKSKISDIAIKRKECVEESLSIINNVRGAIDLDKDQVLGFIKDNRKIEKSTVLDYDKLANDTKVNKSDEIEPVEKDNPTKENVVNLDSSEMSK